jgi:hypothetical protein
MSNLLRYKDLGEAKLKAQIEVSRQKSKFDKS